MASIIYSTIDDIKAARRIANTLVEEQLAACVNIVPNIESFYRWKGKIEIEQENLILAKTVDENIEKTIERLKTIHPYEVPDIIVLPITAGLEEYLNYIKNETE